MNCIGELWRLESVLLYLACPQILGLEVEFLFYITREAEDGWSTRRIKMRYKKTAVQWTKKSSKSSSYLQRDETRLFFTPKIIEFCYYSHFRNGCALMMLFKGLNRKFKPEETFRWRRKFPMTLKMANCNRWQCDFSFHIHPSRICSRYRKMALLVQWSEDAPWKTFKLCSHPEIECNRSNNK